MGALGFEVASEVAAGAAIGWLIDWWLGSSPRGILIGSIAGIAVGLVTLIRRSLILNRQLEDARRRRAPRSAPAPPRPAAAGERGDDEMDDWDRRWAEKWNDDSDRPEP